MNKRNIIKKYYDARSACQVLGNIMHDTSLVKSNYNILEQNDFIGGTHQTVFTCVYNLAQQGAKKVNIAEIESYLSSSDPVSYKQFFDNQDNVEWLHKILLDATPANFDYHYQTVRKFSLLRDCVENGIDVSHILNVNEIDPKLIKLQRDEFNSKTVKDIIKILDSNHLKTKRRFLVKDKGTSRKAGDNAKELFESMKNTTSYGLSFESEYLNTIMYGAKRGEFLLETRDSGCVDCDTEYFNGHEWKPISDYTQGEKVLQYHFDGSADLTMPERYIKTPCKEMWHFETKYGINQTLCDEHNVVYVNDRNPSDHRIEKIKMNDFIKKHNSLKSGHKGKFITTFNYSGSGMTLSDEQIRVMIAVIADGSFCHEYANKKKCRINLKKSRKKERLERLLNDAKISYTKTESSVSGYHTYIFEAPRIEKIFSEEWYNCSQEQLKIVTSEVLYWDGNFNGEKRTFSTTHKESADFVQFAFSSTGERATIRIYDRRGDFRQDNGKVYKRKSIEYTVTISSYRPLISIINDKEKTPITKYQTKDGYKYCFTVESGMLVLRRKDRIFITGNCGKSRVGIKRLLNFTAPYIWDFNKEDFIINPNNPHGDVSALYIGTEMDLYEEIEPMMWCFIAGVEPYKLKKNMLSDDEKARIERAIEILQDTKLYLEDESNFDIGYLWQTIEQYKIKHNIYAVVLDYIELTPALIAEYVMSTKGMNAREDMVLLNLSKEGKNISKELNVFFNAFTQTTDEARRDHIRDQRAVKGARSLPNKVDYGMVTFAPIEKEIEKLQPVINSQKGLLDHSKTPNICYSFYKGRGSEYNNVKVWGYQNLGTFEYHDLFCTDQDYKKINIDPTKIQVVDDNIVTT